MESSNTIGSAFATMFKGGVIMDVMNPEQAQIAEAAGACAVMALERIPSDIRAQGGVARMSDPTMIADIQKVVTIPVMAKVRIGHTTEARILQELGVDYIDESEVLTPADPLLHIDKSSFTVPFVCGATNLGEAMRRIEEGAAMIRTKGEPGTGNVVEAVRHLRLVQEQILKLQEMDEPTMKQYALQERVQTKTVQRICEAQRLPVVTFVAGGIATPADAALMMEMGAEGVFVGSGIFRSSDPEKRARAIVQATTHYNDPSVLLEVSSDLGEAMPGLEIPALETRMQDRGW